MERTLRNPAEKVRRAPSDSLQYRTEHGRLCGSALHCSIAYRFAALNCTDRLLARRRERRQV